MLEVHEQPPHAAVGPQAVGAHLNRNRPPGRIEQLDTPGIVKMSDGERNPGRQRKAHCVQPFPTLDRERNASGPDAGTTPGLS